MPDLALGAALPCLQSGASLILVLRRNDLPQSRTTLQTWLLNHFRALWTSPRPPAATPPHKAAVIAVTAEGLTVAFYQYQPQQQTLDGSGNCGNALAAAAVYAVQQQWLPVLRPTTQVHVRSANTDLQLLVRIKTATLDQKAVAADLCFVRPQGALTGRLLPSGKPVEHVTDPAGRGLPISIVDAANPYVFVPAEAMGLLPDRIFQAGRTVYAALEHIRRAAAARIGLAADSVFPKVALVAATAQAGVVAARHISVPGWHKAYATTGAACLAVAAVTPGTVVSALAGGANDALVLQHPSGTIPLRIERESGEISAVILPQTVRPVA